MRQSGKIKNIKAAIERADSAKSKQPRFSGDRDEVYQGFLNFVNFAARRFDFGEMPDYVPNSRALDEWLQTAWKQEALWAGVINQATLVDSSRGWSLQGGRNQVLRFTRMMHEAEGGAGWRTFFRKQALAYRTTNFGATVELGRDEPGAYWKDGQWMKLGLRALWHVDASRCRWTGNPEIPLSYLPVKKSVEQYWLPYEFFNVCSLPSQQERFHGLGYCSTARAINIMQLLYYVFAHDTEILEARMPDGLLILNGITRQQWKKAMSKREASLDGYDRDYFGGIAILAGAIGAEATLIGLSQLPPRFDRKTFIDQAMYAYSLIAGFDVREFWPASTGTLGTGTEAQEQHRKALTKGALELPHAWQEMLQKELPSTITFRFTERDPRAAQDEAEMFATLTLALQRLRGDKFNSATLTPDEERQILAEYNILPKYWVAALGDAESTDVKTARMIVRSDHRVMRACEVFAREPIVQYDWPRHRMLTIWDEGQDAFRKKVWQGVSVRRQQDEQKVLYEDDDVVITEADVDAAIKIVADTIGDWLAKYLESGLSEPLPVQDALSAKGELVKTFAAQAEGAVKVLDESDVKQRALSPWHLAMKRVVKESFIAQFCLGRGGRDRMTQSDWGKVGSQIKFQYGKLESFAKEVESGELTEAQIRARSRMYVNASRQAYEEGRRRCLATEIEIAEVIWVLDESVENCEDCLDFANMGWQTYEKDPYGGCIPGSGCTKCLSNCNCHLEYKDEDGRVW